MNKQQQQQQLPDDEDDKHDQHDEHDEDGESQPPNSIGVEEVGYDGICDIGFREWNVPAVCGRQSSYEFPLAFDTSLILHAALQNGPYGSP